jgi:hypothetical protein
VTTSRLMFGPDLEPLESESRRGAHPAGARHDCLTVAGTCGDVVVKLMHAVANAGGWCELEHVLPDDGRRPVYVNAHAVRWVGDVDQARG